MKLLPIPVLKVFPCVGASLYSLHFLYSVFGGRPGFDMNISHIFPQGVLVVITLVGSGAEDGGARVRARCELRLHLGSVANTTLLEVEACSKLLEQKLYTLCPSWFCSLQVCVFPAPSITSLTLEGHSAGAERAGVGTQCGSGHRLWWSSPSHSSRSLLICCLHSCQQWLP